MADEKKLTKEQAIGGVIDSIEECYEFVFDEHLKTGYIRDEREGQTARAIHLFSPEAAHLVRKMAYEKMSLRLTSKDVDNICAHLNFLARDRGVRQKFWLRCGRLDDDVYYDLGNREGEVVLIQPGMWDIVTECGVGLKNLGETAEQCRPQRPGDWNRIWKYVNIDEENDRLIFTAFVAAALVPGIEHPIINVLGEAGSGKTTLSRLIKSLIDPSPAGTCCMPRNVGDLMLQLSQNYFVAYDNQSKLTAVESNTLCGAVTGNVWEKKKNYADTELVTVNYSEAIILVNGIYPMFYKEDLLERTVCFKLKKPVPGRYMIRTRFEREFEEEKPFILAGIFDILSKALAEKKKYELLAGNRVGDFEALGMAVTAVTGNDPEKFCEALKENQRRQFAGAIQNHPLGLVIPKALRQLGTMRGPASQLLNTLAEQAEAENVIGDCLWPKTPRDMSIALSSLKQSMGSVGIKIAEIGDGNMGKVFEISWLTDEPQNDMAPLH